MSIIKDWDKAFKQNLTGMSVWPVWTAPVSIGDVGTWKLGPNQRKFTTLNSASSLGIVPANYDLNPSSLEGNLKPNLTVKSSADVSGTLDVEASKIPVDGGSLDASAEVKFSKSDNFYLFTPAYALQAVTDLNGFIKATWDAYHAKNGEYPTDKFLVYGLYIAYGGGVFLATSTSDVDTTVKATYTLDSGGDVKGSFNVDVTKGSLDSSELPTTEGGDGAIFGLLAIRWDRKLRPTADDWDKYTTNPLVG